MFERIKELCKEKGITLARLEKEAGLKVKTIYRWDTNTPSIDKVIKVANVLGVSVDYLCGLTDNKKPAPENGNGLSDADLGVLAFIHSLESEQLRGILVALKAPEELLSAVGHEEPQE